jgi:nucleotide-binding universal stress UspA family protein
MTKDGRRLNKEVFLMAYARILTAIGRVDSNERTLKVTQALAKHGGATVTLMHAIKALPSYTFHYSMAVLGELEKRYSQNIEKKLHYIAEAQALDCEIMVNAGTTKQAIKRACQNNGPDLIVINKGKAARALVQSAPCDVLVVSQKI